MNGLVRDSVDAATLLNRHDKDLGAANLHFDRSWWKEPAGFQYG
jgi:hypothetical protein